MSGIVCHRCFDLVAFDAVYCGSCGARVGLPPRPTGEPHPFHDSMTPGRRRIRDDAARTLVRLDARREAVRA